MNIHTKNPAKQAKQEARLNWIRKTGWIVHTILSTIALVAAILSHID